MRLKRFRLPLTKLVNSTLAVGWTCSWKGSDQIMTITKRFWISLIFSLPMLVGMILMPFGIMVPGSEWIQLILTTVVMAVSARPFLDSAWASFKKHHSNMDTLVAIGTATPISTVFMPCSLTNRFSLKVLLLL
jgi:Cation transport ATPase